MTAVTRALVEAREALLGDQGRLTWAGDLEAEAVKMRKGQLGKCLEVAGGSKALGHVWRGWWGWDLRAW